MSGPLVYLIGAGPGDPGLLTVRGAECVAAADVVVYDHATHPRIVALADASAERIPVPRMTAGGGREGVGGSGAGGSGAGGSGVGGAERLTQPELEALLVEKAREGGGRVVARLHGGDPFVFGRGADEALALREAGVPFEVVPGVTSGHAVPAYAGIPVTRLGTAADGAADDGAEDAKGAESGSAGVAFVSAHAERVEDEPGIDWDEVPTAVGTLVFFMGEEHLAEVVERLLDGARDPDTPVAVIRRGTTPRQSTVTGTLSDIVPRCEGDPCDPPSLVVVGDVVRLRERVRWFEDRPLFGRTIVNTRAEAQAASLTKRLAALGAEVLEQPAIRIADPEDWSPVDEAIDRIASYDWVVLTSTNGVERFFGRLAERGMDARVFGGAGVAAIGPSTAARLRERHLIADVVPDEYVAEGLLRALEEAGLGEGSRVLVPRALEAREVLPETLRERGVHVDVVPVYRTVGAEPDERVIERVRAGEVDAVTFTSSSTVREFLALLERAGVGADEASRTFVAASIGPITSGTAREYGLEVAVQAEEYTIPGLVDALASHYGGGRPHH